MSSSLPDSSHAFQAQDVAEIKDEDDLGYYPDGVRRTLTDQQIAIFRHSEIQSLLREKRYEKERENLESDDMASSEEVKETSPSQELDQLPARATMLSFEELDESEEDGEIGEVEDDDEEYARFLEAERRQFQVEATSNRKNKRIEAVKGPDRITSTRRRVRELDAVMGRDDILDYGDDEPTVPSRLDGLAPKTNGKVEGKRIWWPMIKA